MVGYETIEEAVRQRIAYTFGIAESLVQKGDIDALFDAMQGAAAPQGFLLEYGGGMRLKEAPFSGKMWLWKINGFGLIRFEGSSSQIEASARTTIDQITGLFDNAHTLDSKVAVAVVTDIEPPSPSKVNDVPFYWLPFSIEIMERI